VVTYTPSDIGTYTVGVKFGGQSVPSSPFHVTTSPTGDASKVKILGRFMAVNRDVDLIKWVSGVRPSVCAYVRTSVHKSISMKFGV